MFKCKKNKRDLYILLGILIGTFGATSFMQPNNSLSYAAFLLLIGSLIYELTKKEEMMRFKRLDFQLYDAVPMVLLAVWFYGVILGVLRHNKIENIFRNFAGMTCYAVYYFLLIKKIKKADVLRCVLSAAAVNGLYMFAVYIWDKAFSEYFYHRNWFKYWSVRAYYSESITLLIVPVALILAKLLLGRLDLNSINRRKSVGGQILSLYMYTFALLAITLSKAAVLFYSLFLVFILGYYWRTIFGFVQKKQFKIPIIIGTLIIFDAGIAAHLLRSYVPGAASARIVRVDQKAVGVAAGGAKSAGIARSANAVRVDQRAVGVAAGGAKSASIVRQEQAAALKKELSFFGAGLGATLHSGYSRDSRGYGFENSYLNYAHKFGIFSVLIFIVFGFMGFMVIDRIRIDDRDPCGWAGLTIFGGFILSCGNPVLASPIVVTMQSIGLYLLRLNARALSKS